VEPSYISWLFGKSVYGRHADRIGRVSEWLYILSIAQFFLVLIVCLALIPEVRHHSLLIMPLFASLVLSMIGITLSFKTKEIPLSSKALSTLNSEYAEFSKKYLNRKVCGVITFEVLERERRNNRIHSASCKEVECLCNTHDQQKRALSSTSDLIS